MHASSRIRIIRNDVNNQESDTARLLHTIGFLRDELLLTGRRGRMRCEHTWPPVSGLPSTFCCPKKPWGDRMTTLKPIGSRPKNACMHINAFKPRHALLNNCIITETILETSLTGGHEKYLPPCPVFGPATRHILITRQYCNAQLTGAAVNWVYLEGFGVTSLHDISQEMHGVARAAHCVAPAPLKPQVLQLDGHLLNGCLQR